MLRRKSVFTGGTMDKRAQKKGNNAMILKNGNDCMVFLQHNSPELLYWWCMMDMYNLVFFNIGEMDDDNAVTSCKTSSKNW